MCTSWQALPHTKKDGNVQGKKFQAVGKCTTLQKLGIRPGHTMIWVHQEMGVPQESTVFRETTHHGSIPGGLDNLLGALSRNFTYTSST